MTKRFYKDTALALMSSGFKVIPIERGKKHLEVIGWQNTPQDVSTYNEMLKRYGDKAGTGVITTNGLLAIDIDILDPHVARDVIQYVRDMFSGHRIMVRRGRKPKALIPCYVGRDIGKILSAVWWSEEYGRMQIELLSNSETGSRQFVAYGDYPKDGLHYEWENDYSLLDIEDVTQLPRFKVEMIQPLFKFFDDMMHRRGYTRQTTVNWSEVKRNLNSTAIKVEADDENAALIADSLRVQISDERIEEIVSTMGVGFNDRYDYWIRVGQALKFQIEDSDKGFAIWKAWSRKAIDPETDSPYDITDGQLRNKWNSFKNDRDSCVTFASILYDYYSMERNENFEDVLEALVKKFQECENKKQFNELMLEASYNRFGSLEKNMIEKVIQKEYKRVFGISITSSAIQKSMLECIEEFEMPDYMKNWVYLLNGDKFYDYQDGLAVSNAGFDSLIYATIPNAMEIKVKPSEMALRAYKIPKVIDSVYMPTMGKLFKFSERSKYQYVNSYDPTLVPEEPDEYSEEDLAAIAKVEYHFKHIIEDPEEREIFRQWVAYQVQYTGIPLGWAVFLHGVGGDGKTFFHYLISAMVGDKNTKIVSPDSLKSNFTKWAVDLCFGTIEEVHLTGYRGVEVYDKLKTIIASPTIPVLAKFKDEINAPNTANYLFLSNRFKALPIDSADRRIFAIYSRWQDEKKLQAFKNGEGKTYYPDLHNTYKYHAGALRKYFRTEVKVTDEFLAYYDAPRTKSRLRLIGENMPDAVRELLEIVQTGNDPFLCEDFLDVKYFRQMKIDSRSFEDVNIRWKAYLNPLGYDVVSEAIRLPQIDGKYMHVIFSRNPSKFMDEKGKISNKLIHKYVNTAQSCKYDDIDDL
jgi:hypothetical protein